MADSGDMQVKVKYSSGTVLIQANTSATGSVIHHTDPVPVSSGVAARDIVVRVRVAK